MTDLLALVALVPLVAIAWALPSFVRDLVEHRRWLRSWAADVDEYRQWRAAVRKMVEGR